MILKKKLGQRFIAAALAATFVTNSLAVSASSVVPNLNEPTYSPVSIEELNELGFDTAGLTSIPTADASTRSDYDTDALARLRAELGTSTTTATLPTANEPTLSTPTVGLHYGDNPHEEYVKMVFGEAGMDNFTFGESKDPLGYPPTSPEILPTDKEIVDVILEGDLNRYLVFNFGHLEIMGYQWWEDLKGLTEAERESVPRYYMWHPGPGIPDRMMAACPVHGGPSGIGDKGCADCREASQIKNKHLWLPKDLDVSQ